MIYQAIRCDECGAVKQESNHWFMGNSWADADGTVNLWPWNEKGADSKTAHFCGIPCTTKWAAKQLEQAVKKLEEQQ